MEHSMTREDALKKFGSGPRGLTGAQAGEHRRRYGANVITKKRGKSLGRRIFEALSEPMLIILIVAWLITLGTTIGTYLKTGEGDFVECVGIFVAIVLSVAITIVMEGRSAKAFEALTDLAGKVTVKVYRDGEVSEVEQKDVAVGDILILATGDKIVADGRLMESRDLTVDESMLTGESKPARKDAGVMLAESVPLAERVNMVYSGTYVTGGSGLMLVTAVGDRAEMGLIAGELGGAETAPSPLQIKLAQLGKRITRIGAVSAAFVFALTVGRLALRGTLDFAGVREAFISAIILIVAAVPEGLPTIVAVSLALNVIKLARENALIKKLIATETAGCVSVICSDKTGTLTENKMTLIRLCTFDYCYGAEEIRDLTLVENFCVNSTADVEKKGKTYRYLGSPTEGALLVAYEKSNRGASYRRIRERADVMEVLPFSSDNKYMATAVAAKEGVRTYVKGAPETVLAMCALTPAQRAGVLAAVAEEQSKARRVIAFAHRDGASSFVRDLSGFRYDGYAVISDPVRPDVKAAVDRCRRAGIAVKMLTGDNQVTAEAIAREIGMTDGVGQVVSAGEIEGLSDEELRKVLPRIRVIARSTPLVKLRVVRLLKESGEVVAVTGDGINDAPAMRRADIGISMGQTGSEVAKEASDIVLLDDSFSTIVRAVEFGRNVYKNLQRFIMFQLTVNMSAVVAVIFSLLLGFKAPFTALQLLWINIIMDGPPALSLGFERADPDLMSQKPIGKEDSIVTKKMLFRIILHGALISAFFILQNTRNFLGVPAAERATVLFTMFVLFQLFNAFNCRELGKVSIFKKLSANKPMVVTFVIVFLLQIAITQFGGAAFGTVPLSFGTWVKTVTCAFSVIALSELYKLVYRLKSRYRVPAAEKRPARVQKQAER